MTSTYEKIQTQTLSSAQSSITFTSIPNTYTDLVMICALKSSGVTYNSITFNNDTGTNYSRIGLSGNGSSMAADSRSSRNFFEPELGGAEINNDNNYVGRIQVMNYSNSTTYKTTIARTNDASSGVDAVIGTWRSTSPITTITFTTSNAATYSVGSVITIYGIKAE
jgi:hypothetical protein